MPIEPNKSGGKTTPPPPFPSGSTSDDPLGKTTTRKVTPSEIDPALNRCESGYSSLTSKPSLDSRSTSLSSGYETAKEELELDDDAFESEPDPESDFEDDDYGRVNVFTDGSSDEVADPDDDLDGGRLEFNDGGGDVEELDGSGGVDDLDGGGGVSESVESIEGEALKGFDSSREYQVAEQPFARGLFGEVYLVTQEEPFSDSSTDETLETVQMQKYVLKSEWQDYGLKNEKRILERLPPHKNIVGYHGMQSLQGRDGLLLDYIDGPRLFSIVEDLGTEELSADEAFNVVKFLLQQLLEALAYVHEHGVVHVDIKGNNVMYDKTTHDVKLLDFGSSGTLGENVACGHMSFTAPEAMNSLQGKRCGVPAHPSLDNFAAGQVLFKSLSALKDGDTKAFTNGANIDDMPYGEQARAFMIKLALDKYASPNEDGSYKTALQIPEEGVTDELMEQESQRLGNRDYNGFDRLFECADRFNQEERLVADLINGLLHSNPELRTTAKQALEHPWFTTFPVDKEKAVSVITKIINREPTSELVS